MAILLNDNGYKYVLNWNPSNNNLEVLKYGLTTFDYASGEYLKTLVDTSTISALQWGSWYDTTDQMAPIAGTATAMLCNSGYGEGITKVSNKDFQVTYPGKYNLQFSAQLDQNSASAHRAFIWFRKNGVDEPYSASEVAIQGSLAEAVPSWNYIFDLNAGDYVNVMWSVTNTDVILRAKAPAGVVPGIPSIIITMWKL